MLEGVLTFLILAAAAVAGEILVLDRLRAALAHSRAHDWLVEHIYLPALRMPALIGFVLASYPALYGLDAAASLSTLLGFDWFGRALNLLFALPLVLSLLPVAGRMSALVLPLQGMGLAALLYTPLAAATGAAHASYWPDAATFGALAVFGLGGHVAGSALAERLPRRRLALPAYHAVILLCQAPAVFAYGRALGARL